MSVKLEPTSRHRETDATSTLPAAGVKNDSAPASATTFEFVDGVAAFHATAVMKSAERKSLVANIGPHRRALCARRDLAVRRTLCKVDKVYTTHLEVKYTDMAVYHPVGAGRILKSGGSRWWQSAEKKFWCPPLFSCAHPVFDGIRGTTIKVKQFQLSLLTY